MQERTRYQNASRRLATFYTPCTDSLLRQDAQESVAAGSTAHLLAVQPVRIPSTSHHMQVHNLWPAAERTQCKGMFGEVANERDTQAVAPRFTNKCLKAGFLKLCDTAAP
jgi:hypothetical protein